MKRTGIETTDENGRATCKHVADGEYTVRLLAQGYEPAAATVKLSGSDQELTVVLKPVQQQPDE